MINGAHFLIYSTDPEADRAFLRDVLEFRFVDVGGGWLIFGLPPTEVAVHPTDQSFVHGHAEQSLAGAVLYLMCDDLQAEIKRLESKKVTCSQVNRENWGTFTTFALPSSGRIGLYQPSHPTAFGNEAAGS
ncbi:MAG TPA: VOC family protein [Gemmatimonadales bacterium]|nr:VOC family protein [Gemmatimonadales bacterium]